MTATESPKMLGPKLSLRLVAACVSVAALIGAALIMRGPEPDLTLLPEMAGNSVKMPSGASLYVQKYEVTVAEWNDCHDAGGCTLKLRARPGQDASITPATGLSFVDVREYVTWINTMTGHAFRLPSAAEWNYMADPVLPEEPDPIFTDPSLTWASTYLTEGTAPRALKPQGSFSSSPDGIVDLDGSVWEWTGDCYADNIDKERCPAFYVGGEHVAAMSYLIRDPARGGCAVGTPPAHLGLRIVTDTPLPQ